MKTEPLEKQIDAGDLARVPFGAQERSKEAGAKAAESELADEPPQEQSSSAAPASDGSGALALVEMALGVSVAYLAKRAKIPAGEVDDLRKFDSDERALLAVFAPSAEPYLGLLANNTPQVGAVIFAAAFALLVVSRMTELRERAKRKAPLEENLHRAVFGRASSNIPRETRIVDDGFPPAFTPQAGAVFQPPFRSSNGPDPLRPIA